MENSATMEILLHWMDAMLPVKKNLDGHSPLHLTPLETIPLPLTSAQTHTEWQLKPVMMEFQVKEEDVWLTVVE
jgi:hypothetical protein